MGLISRVSSRTYRFENMVIGLNTVNNPFTVRKRKQPEDTDIENIDYSSGDKNINFKNNSYQDTEFNSSKNIFGGVSFLATSIANSTVVKKRKFSLFPRKKNMRQETNNKSQIVRKQSTPAKFIDRITGKARNDKPIIKQKASLFVTNIKPTVEEVNACKRDKNLYQRLIEKFTKSNKSKNKDKIVK